jgi:hypothetical protein
LLVVKTEIIPVEDPVADPELIEGSQVEGERERVNISVRACPPFLNINCIFFEKSGRIRN